MSTGKESFEELATEVRVSTGTRASAARRSGEYTQARRRPVQQSFTTRRQSTPTVCNEWRTQESSGDQSGTGQCSGRIHQHD